MHVGKASAVIRQVPLTSAVSPHLKIVSSSSYIYYISIFQLNKQAQWHQSKFGSPSLTLKGASPPYMCVECPEVVTPLFMSSFCLALGCDYGGSKLVSSFLLL